MGNVSVSRTVTFLRKGPKGDKGDDGKTLYTWIKYADSVGANGYPLVAYDSPTGNTKYIGIAKNKETEIESNDFSLYKWTKTKGEDGTSVHVDGVVNDWKESTTGYNNSTSGKWAVDNPFCIYYWDGTKYVYDAVSSGKMYVVNADNDSSPKKGHLIIADGGKWKDLGNLQGPQGPQGPQGSSAKVVVVNADSSVFVYSDNFSTLIGPSSISITATLQGTTGYQWSYKRPSMSSFTTIPGSTSQTFGLSSQSTLFGSDKSVTVRCTSGGVNDEVTIAKVSSGSDGDDGEDGQNGKDAYTVLLSNESHVFEGDSNNAIASSTESEVIAYKGATRISSTIGAITGLPNGMSVQRYNSTGTSSKFIVTVNTSLTTKQGVIEIPITVDGKSFIRTFSWALSLKGEKGDKGDEGERGAVGPSLRGPQKWDDMPNGYNFNEGKEGEPYKDVVEYNGNYYSCAKTHYKNSSNYPTSTLDNNNHYWALSSKLEIIASKIILAEYELVKNLGVEVIEMKDSSGNVLFKAKDGKVECNTGVFNNVVVSGLVRKSKTTISNQSDFNKYFTKEIDGISGGFDNTYLIDFEKAGTWLDIQYAPSNIFIFVKNMRSMCGNTIMLYNRSGKTISITGYVSTSVMPEFMQSQPLQSGHFMTLECKIGAPSGSEIPYFFIQRGAIDDGYGD